MYLTSNSTQRLTQIWQYELTKILTAVTGLTIATQISIPFHPVPITLQTVAVLLIGLTYTRTTAIKSILSYLGAGLIGIPVFTNWSGGYLKLVGPSGGYLVGFLVCLTVMTTLKPYLSTLTHGKKELALFIIGQACIYVCGIVGLSKFMSFEQALYIGFVPYLIPGFIKVLLLTGLIEGGRRIKALF